MYKLFVIVLGLTVVLLGILMTTDVAVEAKANRYINKGNKAYNRSDYSNALTLYEEGLAKVPDSMPLKKNIGLTKMKLEDYEGAIEALEAIEDMDLELGNAFYRQGQKTEDPKDQKEMYEKALETYEKGMVKAPEDIELKYNYEWVKALLDNQENQDQKNEDQKNQDQKNQDQKDQDQKDQDQKDQDQKDQDQKNQDQKNQDQKNQDQKNQDQGNQDQGNQDQGNQGDQDNQQTQGSSSEKVTKSDDEALQRILRLLEAQEEDSLKNNQTIIVPKGGDNNDW